MDLERFKSAQDDPQTGISNALSELHAGQKTSHWIWYIFPQMEGLGSSQTARYFGIRGAAEARAYLNDATLRPRLVEATAAVVDQLARGRALRGLMGGETDALKFVSCLTLFEFAAKREPQGKGGAQLDQFEDLCRRALASAEQQGFRRCSATLARLETE